MKYSEVGNVSVALMQLEIRFFWYTSYLRNDRIGAIGDECKLQVAESLSTI